VTVAVAASPRADVGPGSRFGSVLALTLVEGRRLITHPAILVATGLIAVEVARGPAVFHFFFLAGLGYFAIGIGVFVASNLSASRSRRDRTEELFASLPLRPGDRAGAHLLSAAAPLATALLIAGVLASVTRPWEGASVRLDVEPRTIMHGLPDFAQGPLMIAFLGVAGVVLARWFITLVALPVAFAAIRIIDAATGLTHGPLHWLNPVTEYSIAHLEPATVMPWHLLYLAGLILLLGLAALARRPLARGLRAYGVAAVGLTAVGGVMQVLAVSP
jgi:hypothetical protein